MFISKQDQDDKYAWVFLDMELRQYQNSNISATRFLTKMPWTDIELAIYQDRVAGIEQRLRKYLGQK